MSQEKVNTLIQILSSSFYISRHVGQELSIREIAVDLYKLTGLHEMEQEEYLLEFDGYGFEELEDRVFKNRRKKLEETRDRLVESVESVSPEPIKNPDATDKNDSFYKVDKEINGVDDPIVKKWHREFESLGGNSCYVFDQQGFDEIKSKLKKIARYQIKLNAIDKVIEEASLKGKYEFYKEFDSVPDACRYYDKKLGDRVTGERIKNKIRDSARIIEEGEEVSWEKINNRINSWVRYENGKPTRKKEIPKK
ncbi:hypothetical protein [Fodinibius halophilus]|uniref:Uncharacterized protein n=1 Tax=Fodinibius halophilus TaxID=1736908 RepID=A0A6M1T2K0_9BACT|nr:hypothetical protein [Fodinibius halophilus]NGP89696.1 hypothetical protein [Fodinibius halophilus]